MVADHEVNDVIGHVLPGVEEEGGVDSGGGLTARC